MNDHDVFYYTFGKTFSHNRQLVCGELDESMFPRGEVEIDKYYVLFANMTNSDLVIDEIFECKLSDPFTFIKNFEISNLYVMIVKKCDGGKKFIENYINNILEVYNK